MENSPTLIQIIKAHFKNRSALGRAMGVAPQTVQTWTHNNRIPMRRAYQLSELTGGAVTLQDLLPLIDLHRGPGERAKEEIRP